MGRTRGKTRTFNNSLFVLYDTAMNPWQAREVVERAKKSGYSKYRIVPTKRNLEVYVRV